MLCTCENKDADQLCGDRTADQHLLFSHIDSTITLLPKSEISSLLPSSVAVQPRLCRNWLEILKTGFSRNTFQIYLLAVMQEDFLVDFRKVCSKRI